MTEQNQNSTMIKFLFPLEVSSVGTTNGQALQDCFHISQHCFSQMLIF